MDYKDKLRLAKEALDSGSYDKETIEYIFPELKESEGERIRKALISFLKSPFVNESITDEKVTPWIAWLEKQGCITKLSEEEQNRFAKGVLTSCALSFIDYLDAHKYEGKMCVSNGECEDIENAFHNAMWDRLHRYYCKYIEKQGEKPQRIVSAEAKEAMYDKPAPVRTGAIGFDGKSMESKPCEQKPADWSEEDEKQLNDIIELLPGLSNRHNWLKSLRDRVGCEADCTTKQGWNEEDDQYLLVCKNALAKYQVSDQWDAAIISRWLEDKVKSSVQQPKQEWSKEDESLCLRTIGALVTCKIGSPTKCVDEQINWLKSLKERVQPQPKWSEEDEEMIDETLYFIKEYQQSNRCKDENGMQNSVSCAHWLNKLKSLRPQTSWKPSDEQMDALRYVTNFDYGGYKATLVSLYEQLKKLRGE